MIEFKKHKLSETEKEKITEICTTELLRLYKTETDLNSRVNNYIDTHDDDTSHDTVKRSIIDCFSNWNISRLHDDDFKAALMFLSMADNLATNDIRFEYDTLDAYTDKEAYVSTFSTFCHVFILSSWADWEKLCKEILFYHFKDTIELLKKSCKRRKEHSDLLDTILPKGD